MFADTKRPLIALGALAALLLMAPQAAFAGLACSLNNVDPAGQGFNDPTPVTPIGGNPGTTLGAQRIAVFERACEIWGNLLRSEAPVVVQGTFAPANFGFPLTCTPTSATLGAAGANQIFANFINADFADTWYHVALANSIAGTDLAPGPPDPTFNSPPFADDIISFFNNLLDDDPTCLGGGGWYYGFDHNEESTGGTDLLAVVLHEIGHGLGFANFINEQTGAETSDGVAGSPCEFGCTDIYARHTLDLTQGLTWDQMTDAQRIASAINDPNVVWNGGTVTAQVPFVLDPASLLTVNSPVVIAGDYPAMAAAFGPPVPDTGLTGNVVLAEDGVAPDVNDGCEALTNGGAIAGNIALIQRGNCTFVQKVLNAQAVGAVGVVIFNNAPTGLPPMGGSDPTVTIPSCGVEMATGTAIIANLPAPGVNVTKGFDPNNLTGANNGFLRVNAPNPVQPGSSISHWTPAATPNLLMEPSITSDLSDDVDLTLAAFVDEGWLLMGISNIPTLSWQGLLALTGLLLIAAAALMRRRRSA